ncbi:MAG: acyl-CoA thioesterase [Sphingomonadaceae bacterium]
MGQDRTLGHVARIPIRWGDMDAMGHVNNTVYFRYMEQTRIDWFDAVLPRAGRGGHGIVIASTACQFRRALTFPGTVEVRLYVGVPGASSIPTFYEMRVDDDPEPYATGEAVVVFIDAAKGKPVRIPEVLRVRLAEAAQ